jgi:hypothetical protein
VIGVGGQRASRKGALDGYRLWTRDSRDLIRLSGPAPSGSPSPGASGTPGPTPSPTGAIVAIAVAIGRGEGPAVVEGVVTTAADLLDSTGRRIVIQDATAGLEVLLPTDASAPAVGSRIRVAGEIGRAYDAPRLRVDTVTALGGGALPPPVDLSGPPTAAHEWRLVRVRGTIADVHKLGDRWRADLVVGSGRVAISGLSGARIPVTTLVEGRQATITGIARRPYPGATDRRWSVVPRNGADVAVAGAVAGGAAGASGAAAPGASAAENAAAPDGTLDVDLARLAEHVGMTVRVGGLVTETAADRFALDDGTAVGWVALTGEAAEYLPLIELGDALNATGTVVQDDAGYHVLVEDPAGIARVGDPSAASAGSSPSIGAPGLRPIAAPDRPPQVAGGLLGLGETEAAGLAAMLALSGVSLAVTVVRRHRSRRLLGARVAARLASVVGRPAAERGPSVAERA